MPRTTPHDHLPRASLRAAVVWEVLEDALAGHGAAEEGGAAGRTGADAADEGSAAAAAGPGLDVLDTGGGTGGFAVPAALLGHRVTVVDPSPNALFGLQRRAAEAGVADRVRGVQGDIHALFDVAEPGAYDAVLCHGVLEYVDDPAAGLANAVAALRPGGLLSVLAAGLGGAVLARALAGHFSSAHRALTGPDGRWGEADPVPRRFTPDELTRLVAAAGVEVRAVQGVRTFSDLVPDGLAESEPGALEALLELERAAAESLAFQPVAAQLHVLGGRK
ncbi:methyltransferase [Streptomyces sp. 184]|uniref:methyltransferase n=1 Tax=Streptomyces sp. 184 TaxID=1827526 RepID=UPI003892840F